MITHLCAVSVWVCARKGIHLSGISPRGRNPHLGEVLSARADIYKDLRHLHLQGNCLLTSVGA